MAEKFVLAVVLMAAFSALGGAMWLKNGVPPRTTAGVFLNVVYDVALLVVGVWILGGANG